MFANTTTGTGTESQTEHHEIKIDVFGRAIIEGKNFKGSACGLMGERLRRAIGGSRSDSDDKKPEFFQTADQGQSQGW